MTKEIRVLVRRGDVGHEMGGREVSAALLEQAYERGYHRFLRVAEAVVGDVEVAHDVVQEAFARALARRSEFRGEGSMNGWLWRIVLNEARDARRRRARRASSEVDVSVLAATNGRVDSGAAVRAVIAELPERQRLVLFLRYYADLPYREIAAILSIAPGTVAATLNQAHAGVRRRLTAVEL
jgi:RNA polymerase sigma-70 factor, ECF subfamily